MSLRQVSYGGLRSKLENIASTLSKTRLRLSVRSMNGLRHPSTGAVGDSKMTGSSRTAREIRSGRSHASEPMAVAPAEWPTALTPDQPIAVINPSRSRIVQSQLYSPFGAAELSP